MVPQMDDLEVVEKAGEEGLGYFVMSYTDGNEFKSDELRALHKKAQAAMKEYQAALDKILEEAG